MIAAWRGEDARKEKEEGKKDALGGERAQSSSLELRRGRGVMGARRGRTMTAGEEKVAAWMGEERQQGLYNETRLGGHRMSWCDEDGRRLASGHEKETLPAVCTLSAPLRSVGASET